MTKAEIIIHEYDTLRKEIENSFHSYKMILFFGFGIIGALFTNGVLLQISANDEVTTQNYISILSLLVLIPLVSLSTLAMWLGEYQRIQRAGKYLIKLEAKINQYIEFQVLYWQHYLNENNLHMKYPYVTILFLIFSISLISIGIGIYQVIYFKINIYYILIIGLLIIIQIVVARYLFKKYQEVQEKI